MISLPRGKRKTKLYSQVWAKYLVSLLRTIFQAQEKQQAWLLRQQMRSPTVGEQGLFSSFTSLRLPALHHPAFRPWARRAFGMKTRDIPRTARQQQT